MAKYGAQAVFLSTGGYHHHIGANTWQSAGAGRRDKGRSGLAWVEMRSSDATEQASYEDPWGTRNQGHSRQAGLIIGYKSPLNAGFVVKLQPPKGR